MRASSAQTNWRRPGKWLLRVNFRDTASLLSHGDGVLAKIAQSSRQLLTGVRLAMREK
jgi:hypothetical protein